MNGEEEKKPELEKKILKFIPAVSKPDYKQALNTRLKWSGIALLCFFILSYVTVYGLEEVAYQPQFQYFQMVLGAKFGSLTTLGIGPIVTAGIILQLLVGSKIVKWDTTKPEGRRKFQSWNKILAISFCFIEAAAFTLLGVLPVKEGLTAFVILQIAAGGIIIVLLDDLISKWGFGSGVSLFIAAGVASQIFIGLLSPLHLEGKIVGAIPGFATSVAAGDFSAGLYYLLPVLTTAIVFFIVLYIQGIHIDIPLAFSSLRGFGRTWSLKFLYASVIPVIFISALLANIQLMGTFGTSPTPDGGSCGFMGCFDPEGNPKSGAVYYLTAPYNLVIQLAEGTLTGKEILRAFIYATFLALGAMLFSFFWVNTAGMDAKSVANQLDSLGLQIPGYRRDPRVMASVLNRYIPALTILGGLAIGLLAAIGDFLGAIGTGTGILLTVMIFHDLFERLRRERMEEAHPLVRKIVGE